MRYVTAMPCHVSVLRTGVHDLGMSKWSRRCCIGPTFEKVSISLTSCGHLTLAVVSHGSLQGTGALRCSVCP